MIWLVGAAFGRPESLSRLRRQLPLTREPALSVSCADGSPTGGAEGRGNGGRAQRSAPTAYFAGRFCCPQNRVLPGGLAWTSPAGRAWGRGTESLSRLRRQLPLTRGPALSVSCADSSPGGGAKGRGTDCHVAALLAMTKMKGGETYGKQHKGHHHPDRRRHH